MNQEKKRPQIRTETNNRSISESSQRIGISKGIEIQGDEPIGAGLQYGVEIDCVGRIGGVVDRERDDSEREEHEKDEREHEKHRENESACGRSSTRRGSRMASAFRHCSRRRRSRIEEENENPSDRSKEKIDLGFNEKVRVWFGRVSRMIELFAEARESGRGTGREKVMLGE